MPPQWLRFNKVPIRKWGQPKKGRTLPGRKMGPGHLMCCSCCSICRMTVCHLLRSRRDPPPVHPDIGRAPVQRQQRTPCLHNPVIYVRATGAVHLPASATGSVGDSQLAAPAGSRGGTTIVNLKLTISRESGGQMDIKMTGTTSGVGHNQVLQSLNGGVHSVPVISLVGNGVDGEDQTAAGESAGGKGPPAVSTEMEVNTSNGNKGLETSPARKGPIQSSMVTPRMS
jgi:hypothetical protein